MSGFGPFVHRNYSLSALMSEFMRRMPMDAMAEKERTLVEAACIEVDITLPNNGSKLVMPYPQRVIVMDEYADRNTVTAQRFIGRDVLFREPLPAPSEPLADQILPQETDEVLDQFVGPILQAIAKLMTTQRLAREAAIRKEAGHKKPAGQRAPQN
jgi:hypothetical protein